MLIINGNWFSPQVQGENTRKQKGFESYVAMDQLARKQFEITFLEIMRSIRIFSLIYFHVVSIFLQFIQRGFHIFIYFMLYAWYLPVAVPYMFILLI